MNENTHRVYLANEYSFVHESVTTKDVTDGVRLVSGKRSGSETVEGFCYEFNPDKFSLGTALAWMETRGLKYTEARQAIPVAKFAESKINRFWFEACNLGRWSALDAGNGEKGIVAITKAMLQGAVDWVKGGKRPKNKIGHDDDQSLARELFGENGLGEIVDAKLREDGILELETAMPERTATFFKMGLVKQPSVEIGPNGELGAVAFLWESNPAAKGMADVNAKLAEAYVIAPHTFAPPALLTSAGLVLLSEMEAESDPGSPGDQGGENNTEKTDTTSATNEQDSKETVKMSDDLKPALMKMAAGRIDDALGRAVVERRIEPGQVEGEKESLLKLSEATVTTNPDILDASIKMLLSRPQMPDRAKSKADPTAPDTSGALDTPKEDKRPAVILMKEGAQGLVDTGVCKTYDEGWRRFGSDHPDVYKRYDRESYRMKGSEEDVAV